MPMTSLPTQIEGASLYLFIIVQWSWQWWWMSNHKRNTSKWLNATEQKRLQVVEPQKTKKKKSILTLPTKEWGDKSNHSQRPPSGPPKRRGLGTKPKLGAPFGFQCQDKTQGKQMSWHLCWEKRGHWVLGSQWIGMFKCLIVVRPCWLSCCWMWVRARIIGLHVVTQFWSCVKEGSRRKCSSGLV
jgi:hypothetical protein